jgi:type II secretion system protein G
MRHSRKPAFTLIELLIVVAIIAILAAIAVPNFLEAQTRAKVSRAKADMRSLATALETYHIDTNTYVFQNPQYRALRINEGQPFVLENLTTPISYINGVAAFTDPFNPKNIYKGADLGNLGPGPSAANGASQMELDAFRLYTYYARNSTRAAIGGRVDEVKPSWYIIGSAGPDAAVDNLNDPMTARVKDDAAAKAFFLDYAIYDASNGTVSRGGVYRVGGTPIGAGKAFYGAAVSAQ